MSPSAQQLLSRLRADQRVALNDLSTSERAAVDELGQFGIELNVSNGGELSLLPHLDLLEGELLESGLRAESALPLERLHLDIVTGSTNVDALTSSPPSAAGCNVWLTEFQSQGQGRRGKAWRSPFASGLCMSLALRMPRGFEPGRLPLALGMGIRRALMHLGVEQCQLKWPNDLVVAGRKLGGLLLGARQLPEGDTLVIAGLGINVHVAPEQADSRALPSTALSHWLGESMPARTSIAIALINAMREVAAQYARTGFATFVSEWPQADFLYRQEIVVLDEGRSASGVARGIDERGRLLMHTEAGLKALSGGDVSVRLAADAGADQ